MNNKTIEEKILYNIFNNKIIKKELLKKILCSNVLKKDRYKFYLNDRRNTIRILANDTNNHSLIVLFKNKKYYIDYNYDINKKEFKHNNEYYVNVK